VSVKNGKLKTFKVCHVCKGKGRDLWHGICHKCNGTGYLK